MVLYRYFLVLVIAAFSGSLVRCAEFVPVYIWGTSKISDHVPALHKMSEDSFKETMLEYLKEKPYIIAFVEPALSSEDFSRRDQHGKTPFPNLESAIKSSSGTYRPNVQNPIGAIKQLGREVTELSIRSLIDNPNVPKDNILIVDLNDAKDDEHRIHMLQRHDSDIFTIYKDIAEQHDNVIAIYTAHHNSWVEPEEITHKRITRDLLQAKEDADNSSIFQNDNAWLYISNNIIFNDGNSSKDLGHEFDATTSVTNKTHLNFVLTKGSTSIDFSILITEENTYWKIIGVSLKDTETIEFTVPEVYVPYTPVTLSYHCGQVTLKINKNTLIIPGLQIQPIAEGKNITKFGDAYDCVGFTSIPIWSGLFVTAILLFIMTFGLTMMMEIRTMDRFDDSKGKTITINASE